MAFLQALAEAQMGRMLNAIVFLLILLLLVVLLTTMVPITGVSVLAPFPWLFGVKLDVQRMLY